MSTFIMNRFHQHEQAKPRKDLLVDFIRRFSDVDKQVEFFMTIMFSEGLICDKCECYEHYLIKIKGIKYDYISQCKRCGKQHMLMVLSTGEDRKYPRYIKLHDLPVHNKDTLLGISCLSISSWTRNGMFPLITRHASCG